MVKQRSAKLYVPTIIKFSKKRKIIHSIKKLLTLILAFDAA